MFNFLKSLRIVYVVAAPKSSAVIPLTVHKCMLLFTFFLPSLLFFVLLIIYCHLIGVRWHLTVVLIVFPLWLVISYIFSCSCWPSVCHLWKNIYADTLPFFNDLHFFFLFSILLFHFIDGYLCFSEHFNLI